MQYRLNVKSDIHCEEDLLGFDKYIDTLSGMINDKDFRTPFCIGIYGEWGTGKTSFMHLLEKKLLTNETEPYAIPVWFNPWRYEREKHLIIPFLKTIEYEIKRYEKRNEKAWGKISDKLKNVSKKIADVSAAFAYGITADAKLGGFGFRLDASKMSKREEEFSSRRLEESKTLSDKLSSMYYEITNELENIVEEGSFRIVAFIDDLDRCLPDKAVELLEAIKLFLDFKGYLFVIGVDKEVIKKGISYRYRHFEDRENKERENPIISPEGYLDKMIQLPIELPPIEHGRKRRFIESLLGDTDGFKEHSDIIEIGIGDNPRVLKRFVNLLAFTVNLAETLKANILNDNIEPIESDENNKKLLKEYFIPLLYIKWTIIVFRFQDEHNTIKGNPGRLIELQDTAIGKTKKEVVKDEKSPEKEVPIDDRLKKVLSKEPLFPNDGWLIERFIHLTESTVISEKDKVKTAVRIYKPGDMVKIPKGKFLYGDDKNEKELDYNYYIDVFPVTNKQYKEFIENEKYNVPFEDKDWAISYNWDKNKRTYPKGLDNHPVVLVSHDDVVAFCKWRSEKDGKEYRLPTEEEWEKAARGVDGREYPWGDEFDFKKLNCADYHVKKVLKDQNEWIRVFNEGFYKKDEGKVLTTEVGRFINGSSPFGCMDMSGNVMEWTSSKYDKNSYTLRGGSWFGQGYECCCACNHAWHFLVDRFHFIGFRCARTR